MLSCVIPSAMQESVTGSTVDGGALRCVTAAGPPLPIFLNHLPHDSEYLPQ